MLRRQTPVALCPALVAVATLTASATWTTAAAWAQAGAPADAAALRQQVEEQQADINEQEARIKELEKRVETLTQELRTRAAAPPTPAAAPPVAPAQPSQAPAPPKPPPQAPAPAPSWKLPELLRGFTLKGYLQAQYESHQDSEDQARQGGAILNQDRFLLRRARIKIEKEWQYASMMAELDANTVRGPSIAMQHAEASLLLRGNTAPPTPPLLRLTFGLFDVPFGYELTESPRVRYFMERSLQSRAFFPAEPDVGVRITSALGWFRAAVAVTNGEPLGEKSGFGLRDPNAAKDIVARFGAELEPVRSVNVVGGISVLNGKGFHPGTDSTKNGLVWRDINENGQIDAGELTASVGTAATPAESFKRWAIGADLRVRLRTWLGQTELMGELTLGSNMDRGLFVADPVLTSIDSRELGYYVGLTQEITRYGVVGFRFDSYDPNADAQDRQGRKLLPYSQAIRTYSPLVGLVLPDVARLLFQYDAERDALGRDRRGVPTDLKNDTWTLRLQVSL